MFLGGLGKVNEAPEITLPAAYVMSWQRYLWLAL